MVGLTRRPKNHSRIIRTDCSIRDCRGLRSVPVTGTMTAGVIPPNTDGVIVSAFERRGGTWRFVTRILEGRRGAGHGSPEKSPPTARRRSLPRGCRHDTLRRRVRASPPEPPPPARRQRHEANGSSRPTPRHVLRVQLDQSDSPANSRIHGHGEADRGESVRGSQHAGAVANRSAVAAVGPLLQSPRSDGAPTKTPRPIGSRSTASTIVRFVLPASVIRTSARAARRRGWTPSPTSPTGVQTTTMSASWTPDSRSVVTSSTAPTRTASSRLATRRPIPTMRSAKPRARTPARSSRRSNRLRPPPPSALDPRPQPRPKFNT